MLYLELESSTLEFKQEIPKNDQIIKTIIGFCNQKGGKLILGVKNDRTIIGIKEKEINSCLEYLDKAIYDATNPPIIPKIYAQRFKNKTILIIEVFSGMNKPYYLKSKGIEKGTYVRVGRNTIRAKDEIITELKWQTNRIDYEKLPVYQAEKNELNIKQITEFLSSRKNKGNSKITENLLESYFLIIREHYKYYPTIAGVLLFGKKPQNYISEAMIICSHFKGNSGREAIATIDCEKTIIEQFEQAYNFILSRLNRTFVIKDKKRQESFEIPIIAIREALLNAIVHRNYFHKAPIKIAIYDNRVEIFNPGQLPSSVNVNNLKSGITYLRNPAICKIFREAGYIEKLGSGFIAIFESYEKMGLATPQIIDGEFFVKCILPRKAREKKESIMTDNEKIMELLEMYGEISPKDIMDHLSVSRSTATRKLQELIKIKKIIRIGKTKKVRYRKLS
jgi:ATP-dependent DNA helicase RecG